MFKLKETIKKRIIDFQKEEFEYIKRDIKISFVQDMVTTIVGVRKSGKTYLTYQLIDELIENGKIENKEFVCYLHFDDEQLMGLQCDDLYLIDETFYSLIDDFSKSVLFIFDEIHKIKGWENFVLRINKHKNATVIITGSSADLEEGKVSRQLRGKTMTNYLFPLSFKEFLKFREVNISFNRMGTAEIILLEKHFDDYLKRGSFPALANSENNLIVSILKNYYHSIIETDFLLTDGVGNNIVCKDFVTYLLHNNGGKYTHKKTFNTLRSFGHKFTEERIPAWFDLAKKCYFMNCAEIYSSSIKKVQQNYRKIYCIDWALANSVSFPTEERLPVNLESVVYWELQRRNKKISYQLCSRDKYEIDFIVYDYFEKPQSAIQVCWDISDKETLNREIRPFKYIRKEFANIELILIVKSQTLNRIEIPNDIKIISICNWLIESE